VRLFGDIVLDPCPGKGDLRVCSSGSVGTNTGGGAIYFVDLEIGQAANHSIAVSAAQTIFLDCVLHGFDVESSSEYCVLAACATTDFRAYGFVEVNGCCHFTLGGEIFNARGGAGVIHVNNRSLLVGAGPTAGHASEGPGTILATSTLAFTGYGGGNADGATVFPGSRVLTSAYLFGKTGSGSGAVVRVYSTGALLHASGKGPQCIGTKPTNNSNVGGTVAASSGTGLATIADATVGTASIAVNQ
jgi:hypothetical protein